MGLHRGAQASVQFKRSKVIVGDLKQQGSPGGGEGDVEHQLLGHRRGRNSSLGQDLDP